MSTTALHEAAPAVPSTATKVADLAARRQHGMASRRSARRDVSTGDEYGAGQRTRTNLSRSRHRMEGLLRDVLLEVLFHFAGRGRRRVLGGRKSRRTYNTASLGASAGVQSKAAGLRRVQLPTSVTAWVDAGCETALRDYLDSQPKGTAPVSGRGRTSPARATARRGGAAVGDR